MCWSSSGVEDVPAVAARAHEPHAAQQPQLVGDGGLRQAEQLGEVADRHLGARERVEDAHARASPSTLKVSARAVDRGLVEQPRLRAEHMSDVLICSA